MRRYLPALPVCFVILTACAPSNITAIGDDPTATLSSLVYSNGQLAIDSGDTATIALAFNGAATTSVMNGSATTSGPPTGLGVTTIGTASCSLVTVSSASVNGASLGFSGCTGDGEVEVTAAANAALSSTYQPSAASNTIAFEVANSLPTVSAGNFTVSGQTFTVQFDHRVKPFSSNNGDGEFSVSATCGAITPTLTVTQFNTANSSTVSLTVSGSTCAPGGTNTLSAHLNLNLVSNWSGDSGVADPSLTQSYSIP